MASPIEMAFESPLGDDLLFSSMRGTAELGRMFKYEVVLLSKKPDLNLQKLLGKRVSIRLHLKDDKQRRFSGYVVRFMQAGMRGRHYLYHASIRPWLWLLTRRTNCRIFQNQKVEDIVKAIFQDDPYAQVEFGEIGWKLNERLHLEREYCVQYRESDFNFVNRLLEDEGIYYWFEDHDGKDRLTFTDSLATHKPVEGYASLPYGSPLRNAQDAEYVGQWQTQFEIRSQIWGTVDYDFTQPSRPLEQVEIGSLDSDGLGAFTKLEQFEFPGGYTEPNLGSSRAKTRMEEDHAGWHHVEGQTNSRGLQVGALLKLEKHPREDQNIQYLITKASYELDFADYEAVEGAQSTRYDCRFTAMDARRPFVPERITRKPFVQGPQTAITVVSQGYEIYTDKYGRVKVRFHWDRYSKKDENSSCWIRVSQNWGGKGWGGMFIPHIGQEVIVEFLEGDPDRPLITGRVYNAENMPPLELPANKTKSVIRDHGGNEIIMQGQGGSQQMRLFSPTHNTTVTLGNSIHATTDSHFTGFARAY